MGFFSSANDHSSSQIGDPSITVVEAEGEPEMSTPTGKSRRRARRRGSAKGSLGATIASFGAGLTSMPAMMTRSSSHSNLMSLCGTSGSGMDDSDKSLSMRRSTGTCDHLGGCPDETALRRSRRRRTSGGDRKTRRRRSHSSSHIMEMESEATFNGLSDIEKFANFVTSCDEKQRNKILRDSLMARQAEFNDL